MNYIHLHEFHTYTNIHNIYSDFYIYSLNILHLLTQFINNKLIKRAIF